MEPNLNMARHAETRELLGAFALGAVEAEEAASVRAHLATCAECQAEIAQLWSAVDALPELIEPMEPPPGLRDRISAAILAESAAGPQTPPVAWPAPPEPASAPVAPLPSAAPPAAPPAPLPEPIRPAKWWNRAAPWAVAAALLLLLSGGLLAWNLQLRQQIVPTPVVETIALEATNAAPGASGEVIYRPGENLLLLDVRDLPELEPGEVYEVWLIAGDNPPRPAGVFDQSTDQHAIVADRGEFDVLAITNEPGPMGTEAPTGEIVATAAL
jgi:anti-sigma-K factor RskA